MPIIRFVVVGIAKTLSKLFGLATVTLFGRLPSRDDDKIALVGLLALTWIPVAVAVFVPDAAELIVPFAPDDDTTARAIAIVSLIAIPLIAGGIVAFLHNNRGNGTKRGLLHVVSGFVYVPVIAFVLVAIVIVVPLMKASYLAQRFTVHRMMVMAESDTYDDLVAHIENVLDEAGLEVEVERPNRVLVALFRALGSILGTLFDRDVAKDMRVLRGHQDGDWFEVTVHAADITIVGLPRVAARIQAVLADHIDERLVYLTWDDASQELEDGIRALRDRLEDGDEVEPDEVRALVDQLADLSLGREEWDAVRRRLYRLECDVEHARAERLANELSRVGEGVVQGG